METIDDDVYNLISSANDGNQWYHDEVPVETSNVKTVTAPGTYYVTVSVDGCISLPSKSVDIPSKPPKPDETITSVGEARGGEWNVYPNPVKTEITIETSNHLLASEAKLMIYDAYGRLQTAIENITRSLTVPMTNVQPGVYFMVILLEEKPYRRKFIKL